MAKSDNFFNIRGKLGDLIFCERNGKTYVKRYSGGFTHQGIHDNPNIKRAQNRFAQVATFVKDFKQVLIPYLWRLKEGSLHNHLVSVFSQLTRQDPNSSLCKVLQNLETFRSLEKRSLNPKSKIGCGFLQYNPRTRDLYLDHLLLDLSIKYKGMYLELGLGHFQIIDDKPTLTLPEITYFPLNVKSPYPGITLSVPAIEAQPYAHPFLSLAVVYSNNPQSLSPHPSYTQTACFL